MPPWGTLWWIAANLPESRPMHGWRTSLTMPTSTTTTTTITLPTSCRPVWFQRSSKDIGESPIIFRESQESFGNLRKSLEKRHSFRVIIQHFFSGKYSNSSLWYGSSINAESIWGDSKTIEPFPKSFILILYLWVIRDCREMPNNCATSWLIKW